MTTESEHANDQYSAQVIADSVTENGDRLTTMVVVFPRIVLSEFNTHRVLSRNSASSRAIPVPTQLLAIMDEPFVPSEWGMNQPRMQASGELPEADAAVAERIWLRARNFMMLSAVALIGGVKVLKNQSLRERLATLREECDYDLEDVPEPGVHKELASRLLEPFMWHTVVVTATDWSNFFALRDNPLAQPQIRHAAHLMRVAYENSAPTLLGPDQWHLPFIQAEDRTEGVSIEELIMRAVARCARVSYRTHDGRRDPERDRRLYHQLEANGHMSTFEHVARPMRPDERAASPWSGNFYGWHQYRKDIPYEDDFSKRPG